MPPSKNPFLKDKQFHTQVVFWGLMFVVFTLIGLMSAAQSYMIDVVERKMDFSWFREISFSLPLWWFWLAMTPVIIILAKNFRIQRGQRAVSLSIHIPISFFVILVHQLLSAIWCNLHFPPYQMPVLKKVLWRLIHLEWAFVDMIAYWAIIGLYYGYEYYRHLQEREIKVAQLETQLVESELRALKMQLHPHFLFNTMNAISTLVLRGDNSIAQKMIEKFSAFLRMTLEDEGCQEVPLELEIDFAQRYLDVEKIRYQNKLDVKFEIHPGTLQAFVPHLILQPIVENAVRYAIAPMEKKGCICIRSFRENGLLNLQVQDDGEGLTEEKLSGNGIGLSNTRKRLENLYGDHFHLDFKNLPGGGLLVSIRIPFRDKPVHLQNPEKLADNTK